MEIRIKKYGIEFWKDVSKTNPFTSWKVYTIYYSPIENLRAFVVVEIDKYINEKIDLIAKYVNNKK